MSEIRILGILSEKIVFDKKIHEKEHGAFYT